MSLDDLLKEAQDFGLTSREIKIMLLQRLLGFEKYDTMVGRDMIKPGILAALQYENNRELCGEAYARKYMRSVIDQAQKGEETK